jgi:hypothetical protein
MKPKIESTPQTSPPKYWLDRWILGCDGCPWGQADTCKACALEAHLEDRKK